MAQVFIMRWVSFSLLVPVRLVPLSSQPHTPSYRSVLLSCLHSFVSRAHTCTFSALTLALRLFSGRRVCVTLEVTGILLECLLAGGCPTPEERASNKEALQVVLISARTLADAPASTFEFP